MPLACLSIPAPPPFPSGHFVSSKKTVKGTRQGHPSFPPKTTAVGHFVSSKKTVNGTLRFHQKTAVGHFCFNQQKTVDGSTLPPHQKIASGQLVSIKEKVDDAPPFQKKRPAATLFQPEKKPPFSLEVLAVHGGKAIAQARIPFLPFVREDDLDATRHQRAVLVGQTICGQIS